MIGRCLQLIATIPWILCCSSQLSYSQSESGVPPLVRYAEIPGIKISNCGLNVALIVLTKSKVNVAAGEVVQRFKLPASLAIALSFEDLCKGFRSFGLNCEGYGNVSIPDLKAMQPGTFAVCHLNVPPLDHYIVVTASDGKLLCDDYPSLNDRYSVSEFQAVWGSSWTGKVLFVSKGDISIKESSSADKDNIGINVIEEIAVKKEAISDDVTQRDVGLYVQNKISIERSSSNNEFDMASVEVENSTNDLVTLTKATGDCSCFAGVIDTLPFKVEAGKRMHLNLRFKKDGVDAMIRREGSARILFSFERGGKKLDLQAVAHPPVLSSNEIKIYQLTDRGNWNILVRKNKSKSVVLHGSSSVFGIRPQPVFRLGDYVSGMQIVSSPSGNLPSIELSEKAPSFTTAGFNL